MLDPAADRGDPQVQPAAPRQPVEADAARRSTGAAADRTAAAARLAGFAAAEAAWSPGCDQRRLVQRATDVAPGREENAMTDDAVLPDEVAVVNVGLPLFADAVARRAGRWCSVDWRIPAGGDPSWSPRSPASSAHSDRADRRGQRRGASGGWTPGCRCWSDVGPAGDVVPGLGRRTLLHCGPAIDVGRRLRPAAALDAGGGRRRGLGRRTSPQRTRCWTGGEVPLSRPTEHATVVPMATALGPSTPVCVVDNPAGGTPGLRAAQPGPGETSPGSGARHAAAIERLRFLRDVAGPC